MKARVKATGQIVTLDSRCNVTEVVKGGHPRMWTLAELELEIHVLNAFAGGYKLFINALKEERK